MKLFNNPRQFVLLGCVAVSALGLWAPGVILAEGKGASKLMFAAPSSEPQTQTSLASRSAMSCPRCTDGYATVKERSSKGMRLESVKQTPVHLCAACETKIMAVGHGKAKTDKIVHRCGNSGSAGASCCQ